jgi:hypothetical protein
MLLRILRLAARRPLASLAFVVLVAVGVVWGAVYSTIDCTASAPALEADDGVDANPRLILGRAWFDKLPEKATDEIDLWIFFGGGIGIHEKGSRFQAAFEIFDFERQGSKLQVTYLHSGKKASASFTIEKCEDKRPFNLCMTLTGLPGGTVKLYGFQYDDEQDAALPWARSRVEAAKALTAAPRERQE